METSKKNNFVWILVFPISIAVDVIQLILTFTGIGIAVNEALEAITGPVLLGILILFKVPIITKPRRIASLVGFALGDALTGGIAPFWSVDMYYIYRDVKKEQIDIEAKKQQDDMLGIVMRQPRYVDGMRQPVGKEIQLRQPPIKGGIRRADSGLVK